MSRCFPYPPPGYKKDSASGEALIESIKLKREKEKLKIERKKEKKREKKEKKREKKREKSSRNYPGEGKRLDGSSTGPDAFKGCQLQKSMGDEVEQLEKSSITEDHEHGCVQIPSESSDSTHNSHKRKRDASPVKNRGNIIRIRLPLQRHNDSGEARSGKEQVCSTSGRTEFLAQPKVATSKQLSSIHPCTGVVNQNLIDRTKVLSCPANTGNFGRGCAEVASVSTFQNGMQGVEYTAQQMVTTTKMSGSKPTISSAVAPDLIYRPEKELPCPTSANTGNFGHACAKAGAVSKRENRMQRVESHYKSLTENWFPVQLSEQADDLSDLQWLLGTEHKDDCRERAKRCKASANNDVLCCRSPPALFPRARLLPEADIYALPFTVPF